MSPEDIEDHPLLLQKIAAALGLERGFIALRIPDPDARVEFTATYNFDVSRYHEVINSDEMDRKYSQNEYKHLHIILAPLLTTPMPLLTHNISNEPTIGVILPWTIRAVMLVPIPNETLAEALLWCDRKIMRGVWTENDLAAATRFVQRFYMSSDDDTESFVP
jgi:hypothetical protein